MNKPSYGTPLLLMGTWIALGASACDKASTAVSDPPGYDDAAVLDTPLWSDSSRSIDVNCFGFFQGSMRFAAPREQLSAAQLSLLSAMRTVNAAPLCAEDGLDCQIAIVQGDGSTTTIESLEMDPDCGQPRKLVSFATFYPFVKTLGCHYAKDLTYASPPDAMPVLPDLRCYNGLFTAAAGNIIVVLQVDDPSIPRYLELDGCDQPGRLGKFLFAVADNDTGTTIATSDPVADPGVDHACARAAVTFPHAGLFNLTVSVAANPMPAGDFYLRFY